MSVIESSQPFALTYLNQIDGTNGLGTTEALTEFIDNAEDAKSPCFHIATTNTAFIMLDLGVGIPNLGALYSLSPEVRKKSKGNRGLKNMGHLSATGQFNPDVATYITRVGNGKPSTLECKWGEMVAQAKKVRLSGANLRDVQPGTYMTAAPCWTEDAKDRIKGVLSQLPDIPLKKLLGDILENKIPHYTLGIFTYAALPSGLDDKLELAIQDCRLLYAEALSNGFEITYQSSKTIISGKKKEPEIMPLISLKKEGAIPILGDLSIFQPLAAEVEFRKHLDGTLLKVVFKNSTYCFWITDIKALSSGKNVVLLEKEPSTYWNVAKTISTDGTPARARISSSILNDTGQDAQMELLKSSSIQKRDDIRGMYIKYVDRILGPPYWAPTGWGFQRNAGGIRSLFEFDEPAIGEEYVKILAEKNRTNCKNSHPVLKRLFDIMMRTTMDFKDKVMGEKRDVGMPIWDIEDFYEVIFERDTKAEKKAKEEATRKQQEAKKKDEAEALKRLEEEVAAAKKKQEEVALKPVAPKIASGEEQKTPPPKPTPEPTVRIENTLHHVVITRGGVEFAKLNVNPHYYTAMHKQLGDSKFIEYIEALQSVHAKYNVTK